MINRFHIDIECKICIQLRKEKTGNFLTKEMKLL